LESRGYDEKDVLRELQAALSKDIPGDRILCSMCPTPHQIAYRAHSMFLHTNLGDPGIYPGSKELEHRLVSWLGELLHHPSARGYVTSGGTESNIQALMSFKELRIGITKPNVVLPASGHFSFDKAGRMMGIELRRAELDSEFRADLSSVGELVDDNTIGIVGVAGTTELGQVDPIPEIAKIACDAGAFLHVDAAFGGYVLPFLPEKRRFDFELDEVATMTVDPHKMGMSSIPAGCILFRDETYLDALTVFTPYLTSYRQYTLIGTRTGASVAAAYAVMRHLGTEGFTDNVEKCMTVTRWLASKIKGLGLKLVIEPQMNLIAVYVDDKLDIQKRLEEKGWYVSVVTDIQAIRLVIMPRITKDVAEAFADDLAEVI